MFAARCFALAIAFWCNTLYIRFISNKLLRPGHMDWSMTLMSDDTKDDANSSLSQTARLEAAIANERVLLAKVKVKRKRLAAQAGYQPLLEALEQDIARKLNKLQSQLSALNTNPPDQIF